MEDWWNRQELNLRDRVAPPDRATTLSCSVYALRGFTEHPVWPDELLLTGCSLCMKGVETMSPCLSAGGGPARIRTEALPVMSRRIYQLIYRTI